MRILAKPSVIFVHIPKTGGCSISHAMDAIGATSGIDGLYDTHLTAFEIRDIVGTQAWSNAMSFVVVRNPYLRLVSQWCELNKPGSIREALEKWKVRSFPQWIHWLGTTRPNPWYTIDGCPYPRMTNRSQSYYVVGPEMGNTLVTEILHYETLHKDLQTLCKKYALPVSLAEPPLVNQTLDVDKQCLGTPTVRYGDCYNQEMQDIVYRIYHEDFIRFGYEPDSL